MDRFGPTGKVSKKRVHLLRWTTIPCRTGWNFGWMNCALGFWIHMEIAQSKYCTQSGFISQLTGLDSGSQSFVGSGLLHLGCIPDSKAQDSRFHKQKNMGRTYFTGIYVFQWYRSESYHIRYSRGVKKLHNPFWAYWGRFPFDKHSDLKFRKICMTIATVHSGRTYPTQATARSVIALVSRIQKSGTGDNNFVKWKGTFRTDRQR